MKRIGDEIYIQRGEIWSLDFILTSAKGHPYMLHKDWKNAYLAITVTAALYEQEGDFRRTYWLDLNNRWVEDFWGNVSLEPIKKFNVTEPLYVEELSIECVLDTYGDLGISVDETSNFYIKDYLFFTDPAQDGNYVYKYLTSVSPEAWVEYDFRVIKQFSTNDWMEQGYLYDMKLLSGESIVEYIANTLEYEGTTYEDIGTWSDVDTQNYIDAIADEQKRQLVQELFDDGSPLMPDYDVKSLLLQPTRLYVSANIQGGVR